MRLMPSAALLATIVFVSCCARPAPVKDQVESVSVPTLPPPPLDAQQPVQFAGLHNVVTYHEGLYSGSVPEGAEGFKSLQELGVRTIISVDGAAPDVAAAKAQGLRYVHLPITYGGITPERELEIARAVRDLPGPIYVHCHHGKHRSAGATAAAAVTLGYLTNDQAIARMKVSGTAPNYKGLYQCVAGSAVVPKARLDKVSAEFPEISKTSGLVDTMVEVDEINDHLKAIEKAAWAVPSDHPDLVPVAEAARLENLFRVVHDDPDVAKKPQELRDWLKKAAEEAQALEDLLAANPPNAAEVSAKFKLIAQSCKDCHSKYRD